MARRTGPWYTLRVTTVPPAGAPVAAELLPDRACDEWDLRYIATGAAVTITASGGTPARLWGWDGARWVELEAVLQTITRVIADGYGAQDKIPRAASGMYAIAVEYPAGITNPGNLTGSVRTVRSIAE